MYDKSVADAMTREQRSAWHLCVALLVVAVCMVLASVAFGHDQAAWIEDGRFSGAGGIGCCGERDCAMIEPLAIHWNETTVTVMLPDGSSFDVPKEGVHPNGHDVYYWACRSNGGTGTGRCLFIPSTAELRR